MPCKGLYECNVLLLLVDSQKGEIELNERTRESITVLVQGLKCVVRLPASLMLRHVNPPKYFTDSVKREFVKTVLTKRNLFKL